MDSLPVAGTSGQYGLISLPADSTAPMKGIALGPVWKLLNIKDPFTDPKLKAHGSSIPLAVYGMSYSKVPLLLVDLRSSRRIRQRELTQRYINEVTTGIIGVSHFANWYYFVASDLYDFISSRHGAALDQAARLECYSRFRAALAFDRDLDPALRTELQTRANAGSTSPVGWHPERQAQIASARFDALRRESQDGALMRQIDKDRRAEMASFGRSDKSDVIAEVLHDVTFGWYTRRVPAKELDPVRLEDERRMQADLAFLAKVVAAGPRPEVVFDSGKITETVREIALLNTRLDIPRLRRESAAAISRLSDSSHDDAIDSECLLALRTLRRGAPNLSISTASRSETR